MARTIEEIVDGLATRYAAGEDVRQQVIAHQALARLRTELARVGPDEVDRAAGLRQQIGMYRRMVDEDVVDEPAEASVPAPEPQPEPGLPANRRGAGK